MTEEPKITDKDLDHSIQVLKRLTENPTLAGKFEKGAFERLLEAAGRFSRPNKIEIQQRHKAFYRARRKKIQLEDRLTRAKTAIRAARTAPVFQAPAQVTSGEQKKRGTNPPYAP